jgi:site-specific recombinase XerD
LYKQVLQKEIGELGPTQRAKKPERLPTVMSREETGQLMVKILYGCGLRLMECVRLRIKDLDFEQNQIIARDGKGMKDRVIILPEQLNHFL